MLACLTPWTAAAQTPARQAAATQLSESELMELVPEIRAAAAIIYNPHTGDILWENNSHDQRSIASLTKLMTAVTFIASEPDLDQKVVVAQSDVRNASVTYLRAGERVTLGDLLRLTLIASDNGAARAIARTSEGGTAEFVRRMNETAKLMGLTNTHYADPSGLDARNVSTAYDMSHLIAYATAHPTLGPIMRQREATVRSGARSFRIRNTNKLLGTDVPVVGGKTGFIRKAGYCLATLLQVPQGSQLAVVVLGAANSAIRFNDARELFNWAVVRTTGLLTGGQPIDVAGRP
ncbi:MAG: serine hydrolase [Acidobacteriota bacterium]|jgi:D-alanyl-D-alanine endopeptidase (penicillin-binding protein 7)|nr:MAG: hypothetical protein DIU54_08420 [Acidobacteriota bacterium]